MRRLVIVFEERIQEVERSALVVVGRRRKAVTVAEIAVTTVSLLHSWRPLGLHDGVDCSSKVAASQIIVTLESVSILVHVPNYVAVARDCREQAGFRWSKPFFSRIARSKSIL